MKANYLPLPRLSLFSPSLSLSSSASSSSFFCFFFFFFSLFLCLLFYDRRITLLTRVSRLYLPVSVCPFTVFVCQSVCLRLSFYLSLLIGLCLILFMFASVCLCLSVSVSMSVSPNRNSCLLCVCVCACVRACVRA